MQVFLPYPDFKQSVQCLDKPRLGNQIWRECKTIMNGGWPNHPVSKMWKYHKHALALYMWEGITELLIRNQMRREPANELSKYLIDMFPHPLNSGWFNRDAELPSFIGNVHFHRSHRLNLLFKNPEWYGKFFHDRIPRTKPEYIWPRVPIRGATK